MAKNILSRLMLGSLSVSEASRALFELKGGGVASAGYIVLRLAEAQQRLAPASPIVGSGAPESTTGVPDDAG
jgi:hypothetical protein